MTLTEEQSAALALIVNCGAVVMERGAFDAAARGMADGLIADNLLIPWEVDKKGKPLAVPLVTLTPAAADALKVEIVELGPNWQVWDDRGKPARPMVADRFANEYRLPYPEMVVDHRPGPVQEVEYKLDRWTGEPLKILGHLVPIDRRLSKGRRAG